MKRLQIAGLMICGVVIAALTFFCIFESTKAPIGPTSALASASGAVRENPAAVADSMGQNIFTETGDREEPFSDQEINQEVVVARLRELYGRTIFHPRIQLRAIEKLTRYLKELYGDCWPDHMADYLALAFPDQAAEMFDKYLSLVDFKEWINGNQPLLVSLDPNSRKALLWEKRKQFFGDEAEKIWEMEIRAEQVVGLLETLDRQSEMPLGRKIDQYLANLDDIYQAQAETYKQRHRQELIDQFLTLAGVQAELRRMNDVDRRDHLSYFRRAMGLDEAALARWAGLDATRDKRWENGQAYLRQRRLVTEEGGGPDREYRLDQLRQTFFGAEASTVKQEEEAGLFRFEQPRVYGMN